MDAKLLDDLKTDPLKLYVVVSKAVPLTDLFEYRTGNIFCPFHLDQNKPSAVFHVEDEDGIEKLHCYACGKFYTSYHYLKLVMKLRPLEYLASNVPEMVLKAHLIEGSEVSDSRVLENISYIQEKALQYNEPVDFLNNLYIQV